MNQKDFEELLDAARELYLLYPGVVSVEERENLLRIKVANQEVADNIPKTFLFKKKNYEIGTEVSIITE